MTGSAPARNLVVLVADGDLALAIEGLLEARPAALGIRRVTYDVFRHLNRDPGCLLESQDFLRRFSRDYDRALVVFDHEGSGREGVARETLEAEVESRLAANGWRGRSAAVVVTPELEVWAWAEAPELEQVVRWRSKGGESLRRWLLRESFLEGREVKPARPKEAFEAALRLGRRPRSAAIYRELAERVPLEGCVDPAFAKLKTVLWDWFRATERGPREVGSS